MTNTQIVMSLVNLEPDLDVLEVEEEKRNGKVVKVIHIKELDVHIVKKIRGMYTIN